MAKRIMTSFLLLTVVLALVFVPSVSSAAAAQPLDKPAKLSVRVDIADPKLFWGYSYITADGKVRKPAAVQAVWSTTSGMKTDRGDVVLAGKDSGKLEITSERTAFVDVEIQVVDANRYVIGKTNIQVRNSGQQIAFVVYPPESTAPSIEVQ